MPFDAATPQDGPSDLDLLICARSRLEQGWTQRLWYDGRDNVCAIEAVAIACGNRRRKRRSTPRERRLARYLANEVTLPPLLNFIPMTARQKVIAMNDRRQTTKEMMLAVFDRAIERLAGPVEADALHRLGEISLRA